MKRLRIRRIDLVSGDVREYESIAAACLELDAERVKAGGFAKGYEHYKGNLSNAVKNKRMSEGYLWERVSEADTTSAVAIL